MPSSSKAPNANLKKSTSSMNDSGGSGRSFSGWLQKRITNNLTYETPKMVTIKDPWLGLASYVAWGAVVFYFIAGRMLTDLAYMKTERITGVVQTSIRAPATVADAASVAYCSANSQASASQVLPCVANKPAEWVAAPSTGGEDMFVATRIKYLNVANLGSQFFVLQPEEHTIGITFSLSALGLFGETMSNIYHKSMEGLTTRMLDLSGNPMSDLSGNPIGCTAADRASAKCPRFDIMSVATLLRAAGINSLDDQHDAAVLGGTEDTTETIRYAGLVLLVSIDCPMDLDGSVSSCDYRVKRLPKSEAEAFMVSVGENDNQRQERRGVKIVIRASGVMGAFDFPTFLVAVASTFSLMTIVFAGLTMIMKHCLPKTVAREVYKMVALDESPDIVDARKYGPAEKDKDKEKALEHIKRLMIWEEYLRGERDLPFNEKKAKELFAHGGQTSPRLLRGKSGGQMLPGRPSVNNPMAPQQLAPPTPQHLQPAPQMQWGEAPRPPSPQAYQQQGFQQQGFQQQGFQQQGFQQQGFQQQQGLQPPQDFGGGMGFQQPGFQQPQAFQQPQVFTQPQSFPQGYMVTPQVAPMPPSPTAGMYPQGGDDMGQEESF